VNTQKLIQHILENHEVYRRGRTMLVIDEADYRNTQFNQFLTNKKLMELQSDLMELEDIDKKAAISAIANKLISNVIEYKHKDDIVNMIPEGSILEGLDDTGDLLQYVPVKEVTTGETLMFCLRSEMVAEMSFQSWLELVPGEAHKQRPTPCIAVYDPIEMQKCWRGQYKPTSKGDVQVEVLFINTHIKPAWRQ